MIAGSRLTSTADRAGILRVDIAAGAADLDLLQRGLHRGRERRHDQLALLDQEQRRAARRARAEPRQPRQELDQRSISGPATAVGMVKT
jgi:hypothetical protein